MSRRHSHCCKGSTSSRNDLAGPNKPMRLVIVALSVGFFVTLVLAWYHGERGAQRVSGTELLIMGCCGSLGRLSYGDLRQLALAG